MFGTVGIGETYIGDWGRIEGVDLNYKLIYYFSYVCDFFRSIL